MIKIIVNSGEIEVYCLSLQQAYDYIERKKKQEPTRFTSFSIWEVNDGEERYLESRGQVQEDIQEPTNIRTEGRYGRL